MLQQNNANQGPSVGLRTNLNVLSVLPCRLWEIITKALNN